MAQFEVYFDTIFPSENSIYLPLLHKNNAIVAKPLLGSLEKNKWCNLEYILLKFALNNVIVVRCNFLRFGVNFDEILLKNIQKRTIFIYNNDIAAAMVELWSFSTNAKYAESSSTNYILCEKQRKVSM